MSTRDPGIWFGVEREEYERLPRVNWSTLKWIDLSPAHYQQVLLEETEDTDAMKLGRACHIAVFEPDLFKSRCIRWDGGARRGKDWEALVRAHPDDEILTEHQYDTALAVGRAVRTSAMAAPYVSGGQGEVTVLWNCDGVDCKSRIDFVAELGALVDLKGITRIGGASPETFPFTVRNLKYKAQAAFYRRAYQHATGKLLPYFLVAAEMMAPFAVQVYQLTDAQLEEGEGAFMQLLEVYKGCRARNVWQQYADQVLPLPEPFSSDEGIDDLGIDIGSASVAPAIGF
jgi:exodeoxyribonuclease VIII